MIPDRLNVEIVTPTGEVVRHDIDYVRAPGMDGLFGVLPGHVPAIIALDIGEARLVWNESSVHYAISGGYAEIHRDRVVLLVESAERADQIDVGRAQEAEQRARKRLEEAEDDVSKETATQALRRAQNRIKVAEQQ